MSSDLMFLRFIPPLSPEALGRVREALANVHYSAPMDRIGIEGTLSGPYRDTRRILAGLEWHTNVTPAVPGGPIMVATRWRKPMTVRLSRALAGTGARGFGWFGSSSAGLAPPLLYWDVFGLESTDDDVLPPLQRAIDAAHAVSRAYGEAVDAERALLKAARSGDADEELGRMARDLRSADRVSEDVVGVLRTSLEDLAKSVEIDSDGGPS